MRRASDGRPFASFTVSWKRPTGKSAGGPPHAPRPFGVVVPHADFVVDGVVLLPAVQEVAAIRAFAQRAPLAGHAEQILVQVAAERPPDHVVVEDALGALLRRVALQPQA